MKKLELPKSLIELSDLFKKNNEKLYIVGGFVRNALLGFCETDIDICGRLRYDEIQKMLKNTIFSVKLINEKLSTVHIKSKVSEEEFEYSTFRVESYNKGGNHTPTKIEFVDDIKKEYKRRDFTCNAIYYDIQAQKIVDYCDGVRDVLEHTIKTVDAPTTTFDDDGLRILRMVRFASELDFDIDEDTFLVAKQKISNLKDISQERFNKEFFSILFSDFKYDSIKNPSAPTRAIKMLCELEAFSYIFREIAFDMSMKKINENLKLNWLVYFGQAPSIHRLSVFVYDFLKALKLDITKNNIEKVLGQNGLMVSKNEIKLQSAVLTAVEEIKSLKENDIKLFIQKNHLNITRIIDLSRIFGFGDEIKTTLNIMICDKVPMEIKDLAINGYDIMNNFPQIEKSHYSSIFEDILTKCCFMPEINEKQRLLNYVRSRFIC